MIRSLVNALREAVQAGKAADDARSAFRLAADFLLSRLLKFRCFPGRDQPRSVCIRRQRVCYRFNRGDIQSLREVLVEDAYELPFPLVATHAIDLGANIGLWGLWLGRSGQPLKQLIAVEPDPDNAGLARKNLASSGIPATVIEGAIGGSSGTALFAKRRESNLGGIAMHQGPVMNEGQIEVRMLTMTEAAAEIPAGSPIDLVKMDIEGGEQAVFTGDLSWLERTRALIIEWHPDRCDPRPMMDALASRGFRRFPANARRQENLDAFLKTA